MAHTTTRWPAGMAGDDDWRGRARVRARALAKAWGNWLAPIPWQFFATLTFDPHKVFPVDAVLASKEAFWWCSQLGRLMRRPVGWLYAVERGRGGCWHAHVLLVGVAGDIGPAPIAMWEQRNGLIHVRSVDDTRGGVLYSTKEAALSGEVAFSDTLGRYRLSTPVGARVDLCPAGARDPTAVEDQSDERLEVERCSRRLVQEPSVPAGGTEDTDRGSAWQVGGCGRR